MKRHQAKKCVEWHSARQARGTHGPPGSASYARCCAVGWRTMAGVCGGGKSSDTGWSAGKLGGGQAEGRACWVGLGSERLNNPCALLSLC